jgi:ATP-dependent Lon protease
MPEPTLEHLSALARQLVLEIARADELEPEMLQPLEPDELDLISRAWARAGFSLRKLQKIVAATLEARDTCARRH